VGRKGGKPLDGKLIGDIRSVWGKSSGSDASLTLTTKKVKKNGKSLFHPGYGKEKGGDFSRKGG